MIRLVGKLLTENQMVGNRQMAGRSLRPKSLRIYISWYINDYGPARTSSDVNPRIRAAPWTNCTYWRGCLFATTDL
jgi:hypothetical protein